MRFTLLVVAALSAACFRFDVAPRGNNRPVAKAQVVSSVPGLVVGGTIVTLDAKGSSDADGDALTYRWAQLLGADSDAVAIASEGDVVTFEAPRRAQTLVFTLVVSDGLEDSAPLHVAVEISSKTRPVASAGEDFSVALGQAVVLDGATSHDPDGDPLSFRWTQVSGPPVEVASAESARATFVAPQDPARLLFNVEVTDGRFTSTDAVTVDVRAMPIAIVRAGVGAKVLEGGALELEVSPGDQVSLDASNSVPPPGNTIDEYRWTPPPWLAVDALALGRPRLEFAVPQDFAPFTVKLQVASTIGGERVASMDARVSFAPVPKRPVARARAQRDDVLNRTAVRLDGSGSSEDAIFFAWSVRAVPPGGEACLESNACLSGADTPTPVFTPVARGDYTIRLVVRTGDEVESFPAFVLVTALNNPPLARAGADRAVANHERVTLGAAYADVDGDLIGPATRPGTGFHWEVVDAPDGADYEVEDPDTRDVTFTPRGKGRYVLSLRVHDGLAESAPDLVTVVATNTAPVALPIASVAGKNRTPIALNAGASRDPDGDALFYSWSVAGGGDGVISDVAAASPTFTPESKGQYTLALKVSDGQADSPAAIVTVTSRNNAPVADAGPDQPNVTTARLALDASLSRDLDGDRLVSYRWRLASGPELGGGTRGLDTVRPELEFAGTGQYVFGLVVNDGEVASEEDFVTVSVTDLNRVPVADAGLDRVANTGSGVTLTGAAADPDGDAIVSYIWTRVSDHPALPQRMTGTAPQFTAPATYDAVTPTKNEVVWALTVTDARGATSAADTVSIFLAPPDAGFVFVSPGGSDTNTCGARTTPCATLARALHLARHSDRDVVVAAGTYDNTVRTQLIPYGVNVLGGFDPVTWQRDPARFVTEIAGARFPVERPDLHDNDCDGSVDEADPPGLDNELCNNFDDDGDGSVDDSLAGCAADTFEPNDVSGSAKPIELGRFYQRMDLDNCSNTTQGTDWFRFTLPHDLPADPDGAGPLPPPVELELTWRVYGQNRVVAKTVTLRGPDDPTRIVRQMQCTASECAGVDQSFSVSGLKAGTYYLLFQTGFACCQCYEQNYQFTLDLHVMTPAPRDADYCRWNATITVPPAALVDADRVPLLEGLRVRGTKGDSGTGTDAHSRAVYCNECAVLLRGNEIWGDGSELVGGRSAAVHVKDSLELAGSDYAVRLERNVLRIGVAEANDALLLENARDVLVTDNRLEGQAFSPASRRYALVRLEGTRTGGKQLTLDRNRFVLAGSTQLDDCRAISLDSWAKARVTQNVFDLRSTCGGAGGGAYANAVLVPSGTAVQQLLFANNAIFGLPSAPNRSVLLRQDGCASGTYVTLRNNYVAGLDRGLAECEVNSSAPPLLAQWNGFWNVAELYTENGASSVDAAALAGAGGRLGRLAASDGNFADECPFMSLDGRDYTPAPGSVCVDAGGLSRAVPTGYPTTLGLGPDALGQSRTVDLPAYLNAAEGDGTDVGPVERQQP